MRKVNYYTVPEELHFAVVFLERGLTGDGDSAWLGGLFPEPNRIELYLDMIFNSALVGEPVAIGVPTFRSWYILLHTCYREFDHRADLDSWNAPERAYEAR